MEGVRVGMCSVVGRVADHLLSSILACLGIPVFSVCIAALSDRTKSERVWAPSLEFRRVLAPTLSISAEQFFA